MTFHRMRLYCCLVSVTACSSALAAGPPDIPRYVTSVHCEPHHAKLASWTALVNLVAAADLRYIKLTIQFSPQWVPLILPYPNRRALIAAWHDAGHEIAAHHHTIDHAAMWDGYSNEKGASAEPDYLGDMQDWRWVVSQMLPPDQVLRTVSSQDVDFPGGIAFQLGGDGGPGAEQAASVPTLKDLPQGPAWNLSSAALIYGGNWYNAELETAFANTDSESIFAVAFHPSDYYSPDTENIDAWLDFLHTQDPLGLRSATVQEILTPYDFQEGDVNHDGIVNGADLALVLADWNTAKPDTDINADQLVNGADLALVLVNWTP